MAIKRKSKGKKTQRSGTGRVLSPAERDLVAKKVAVLADPLCAEEGLELVHVEFVADGFLNVLRVYIDKTGGVSMENCSGISRQLGDIIDVEVFVSSEYRLEVSSPGIYRHLYKKEDYNRFCGQMIKIQTVIPIEGRKNFKGVLKGISESGVVEISVDGGVVELDYSTIKKARLTEDNGDDRC